MKNTSNNQQTAHTVQVVCDGIIQITRHHDQHMLEIEHMNYQALYAEERHGHEIIAYWSAVGMGIHVNTLISDWLTDNMDRYRTIDPNHHWGDQLLPKHLPKAKPAPIEPPTNQAPDRVLTGTQVRLIRESLGASAKDFAFALGAHFQTVNHWQAGGGDMTRATALIADLLRDLREVEETLTECREIEVHSKGYRRLKNGRIIPESIFQCVVGKHVIHHPEKLVRWTK